MTDQKKPFTVTDRRLFTSDGDRRESPEPETRERAVPAPEPQADRPRAPAVPPPGPAGSVLAGSAPAGAAPEFAEFLLSLAAQASMLLGREGQPADLAGAREMIGILEMLRDKTEGRRSAEEDEVLESILYQLRLAYLHKAGGAGA
jgi:hypothetical protein